MILAPEARLPLLRQLSQLAFREAELFDARTTFLPLRQHREALSPPCVLVLGERGAGKSAFFRILIQQRETTPLRRLFENDLLPDFIWMDAFSESPGHPQVFVIDELALKQGPTALRAFWLAHLLRRLHRLDPTLMPQTEDTKWLLTDDKFFDNWMATVVGRVPQLGALLDGIEETLATRQQRICAVYDHLDHIGAFHPEVRRKAVGTLLALWHSLSLRFKHLRGKILLREDLYDDVTTSFADASKLRARAVTLRWSEGDLFRVLVRHISAAGPDLAAWLKAMPEMSFRDEGEFGLIPGEMADAVQRVFCSRLVSKVVGSGITQTYTHRWLRSVILDARQQAVPRTLVSLIGNAAVAALDRSLAAHPRLLEEQDLYAGLRQASLDRMGELREDHPIVRRLENLARREMPMRESVLVKFLAKKVSGEVPGLPEDGTEVLTRLMRLGVMLQRGSDKLYDVPDLYLFGFGLNRVVEEGRNERSEIRKEFGSLLTEAQASLEVYPRKEGSELERLAEGAERVFEALKIRPKDRQALSTLANLTERRASLLPVESARDAIREALPLIEQFHRSGADSFILTDETGKLYESLAYREPELTGVHLSIAEQMYRQVLRIKPDYFSGFLHLARNLVWQAWLAPPTAKTKLEEATYCWKQGSILADATAGPAGQAWARRIHGDILEAEALWLLIPSKLIEAEAEYRQSTMMAASIAYGWNRLGWVLIHQAHGASPDTSAKLVDAEGAFREALWLSDGMPQAECGLAYVLLRQHLEENSLEKMRPVRAKLEEIATRSPAPACYPLACYYGALGEIGPCEDQLQLASKFGQLPPANYLKNEPTLTSIVQRPLLKQLMYQP